MLRQATTTKIIISMILLITALILSVGSVSAADNDTIYVNDTGGNDDNNGTSWEWAKKSIKNATGTVNANGTVNIADGLYTGIGNTEITIDKNMNIIGQSQTGAIIDAENIARIFNIPIGITVTIANLTLTNGNGNGGDGGAILNDGDLTVTNSNFTNNAAPGSGFGGAILNDGNLTVTNSAFTDNTASVNGGAIFSNIGTVLTVTNCTFTHNIAASYNGGAILNNGNLTVTNSTFTNNHAYGHGFGGAISNNWNNSILTVINSIFTNNTANNRGGAISNLPNTNTATLVISGCEFKNNTAVSYGGAIYSYGDSSTVSDSTFTNNTAYYGGAIYNDWNLTVTNSNFIDNNANYGGAIFNYDILNVLGSTFTDNDAWNGGAIYNEEILTVTNSNFTHNTALSGGAIYNVDTSTVSGSNFNSNTAYYRGGAIVNSWNLTVTNSTFNNNTATGTSSYDGGAAICSTGTLNVTGSTFKDNDATASDSAAVYNYGGTLDVTSSTFTDNKGGAIVNENEGTLKVANSKFIGNNVIYHGGAIWNGYSTTCTVSGSTFTGNTADGDGGAIYNEGTLTVNFCRIVGNTADGDGDAIYNGEGSDANAENNWWGSNNPDFASLIYGDVDYTPWLFMTLTANPTTIKNGETSQITVSFNNYSSDGITFTPLPNPAAGHIPDGTPVTFNTDLGSIGCKTIEKQTIGGIATAILTADEIAGIAHVNATTDNQTLFVNVTITPKSSLYLTVTPDKANPVAGDTVVYTLKVGNKGPDTAKDVVMTYVVPEGLEFAGAKVDVGEWNYDATTRTITWNISEVPKGDPYMWLSLSIAQAGQYIINPTLITSTYDPTLNSEIQSLTVNAVSQTNTNGNTTVKAASKTIPLQKTGMPLAGLVMAIMAVSGGLAMSKRK